MKLNKKPIRDVKLLYTEFSYKFLKKRVTSNASRNISYYKFKLPMNFRYKKLNYRPNSLAGRVKGSPRLIFSKGKKSFKYSLPKINYSFRSTHVSFIAGLIFIPFINKLVSIIFTSTGSVSYLISTKDHRLFMLTTFKPILYNFSKFYNHYTRLYPTYHISQVFKIVRQLPKNKPVCLIEQFPLDGVKYIRSPGSKGKILKMDTRTQVGILKLPSNIHKTISIYSIASLGQVYFSENKKLRNTKSGYYRNWGIKSRVRGVAKNPVDHPHGGRTKSIKLPRTPWGKVAKLKS
uniref:Ribosomal protein L2 n=1 Tax=Strombidium cf. sulcatum TaxID=2793073 RepID=A0A7T0Q5S4_9SPIT|nr:ribosomal protein L2 [Strombidium cf. sulcatum]QPL15952.1 ribosomal protein L2 [Strombidium cf. sulcatum]